MNNKLMVAKSFQNWDRIGEPFEKNGKLYTKVKTKCDRCGGLGIIVARVENGRPIPIPVDEGICYTCLGSKYQTKDVRLYTEEEYIRMEKANEAAKEKKKIEQETKMKAEFTQKKAEWLQKNGFTEDGVTYIITNDSYSIKDELKTAGWRYDSVLKWHKADPTGYEDRVFKVTTDEVLSFSAWGEGHYKAGAADYIEKVLAKNSEDASSAWIGTKGDKIDVDVTFVSKRGYQSKYGYSNVYTFRTAEGDLLTWFSTVEIKKEIGEKFKLIATVKDHSEYKGIKSTVITRGKIK